MLLAESENLAALASFQQSKGGLAASTARDGLASSKAAHAHPTDQHEVPAPCLAHTFLGLPPASSQKFRGTGCRILLRKQTLSPCWEADFEGPAHPLE